MTLPVLRSPVQLLIMVEGVSPFFSFFFLPVLLLFNVPNILGKGFIITWARVSLLLKFHGFSMRFFKKNFFFFFFFFFLSPRPKRSEDS